MKKPFLNLGKQYIANGFLTEEQVKDEISFNLTVGFDEKTKLVSLIKPVEKALIFNENYAYRASLSTPMIEHFKEMAERIKKDFVPMKLLEIGSNDGIFLKNFDTKVAVSVEPCKNYASEISNLGYGTFCKFWNIDTAQMIKQSQPDFDVIYAANCFCHLPPDEINEAFGALRIVLEKDGMIILEDPSLASILNTCDYSQIYDEHPILFSVISINNLAKQNGLMIHKVEKLKVHNGSTRVFICRQDTDKWKEDDDLSLSETLKHEQMMGLDRYITFVNFAERCEQSRRELKNILENYKKEGKKIACYAATSKTTTIFNYCDIGKELIECITDTTPDKIGKLSPGKHIPIVDRNKINLNDYDVLFLGASNYKDYILDKEKDFLLCGGVFVVHIPIPHIVQLEIK